MAGGGTRLISATTADTAMHGSTIRLGRFFRTPGYPAYVVLRGLPAAVQGEYLGDRQSAGIGYKATPFMVRKLKRSFYARRIYERLQGEVEIDEAYVKAGLKVG